MKTCKYSKALFTLLLLQSAERKELRHIHVSSHLRKATLLSLLRAIVLPFNNVILILIFIIRYFHDLHNISLFIPS